MLFTRQPRCRLGHPHDPRPCAATGAVCDCCQRTYRSWPERDAACARLDAADRRRPLVAAVAGVVSLVLLAVFIVGATPSRLPECETEDQTTPCVWHVDRHGQLGAGLGTGRNFVVTPDGRVVTIPRVVTPWA